MRVAIKATKHSKSGDDTQVKRVKKEMRSSNARRNALQMQSYLARQWEDMWGNTIISEKRKQGVSNHSRSDSNLFLDLGGRWIVIKGLEGHISFITLCYFLGWPTSAFRFPSTESGVDVLGVLAPSFCNSE